MSKINLIFRKGRLIIFSLIEFQDISDDRGSLVAIENNRNIPFEIKRTYYIYNTKNLARGFHAHKKLQQILICLNGSCKVNLDDGKRIQVVELNTPTLGLYITGLVWREMYDFSKDCILLVLANQYYDEDDYIRDYDIFRQHT